MNEEDIFPTFDTFGPLKDVAIIRDKQTGMHRGCAFVTFWAAADAERARDTLHDKFIFPGAKRSAQVKRAEPTCKCKTSVVHFRRVSFSTLSLGRAAVMSFCTLFSSP